MISARDRSWNSATTLYIARKLEQIANAKKQPLKVLDMGCGDGIVMEHLLEFGHDIHGYDLETRFEGLRARLGHRFQNDFDTRFRVASDERSIPFENASFDVVYANQVFEHVRFLDSMVAESARVLKPGGTLIALFPLATYPVELHVRIPFAHWIPPGDFRVAYMRAFYALHLRPRVKGKSAHESALYWESFLRECCFYRFYNELKAVFTWYFDTLENDAAGYIQAKIDLLNASQGVTKRVAAKFFELLNGPRLESFITYAFGATFAVSNPRRVRPTHPSSQAYQEHLAAK